MPIFAYRCEACGFEKDALQKRSDPPLTDCPSCGKATFRKQVSAPAFQLKGSGWYVTDFRDGGKSKGGDGKSESTTSPAPSSSSASSSGPAADSSSGSGSSGASTGASTGSSPAAPASSGSSSGSGSTPSSST